MKFFRATLVAAAIAGAALSASADTVVGVHLASRHFPSRDFSNTNPGVYVRLDNGATAGAYRNSYGRGSVYAGYTYEWGRLGVTMGLITGYPKPWLLVPSVKVIDGGNFAVRLAYIPAAEKNGSHVLHLMAETSF